MMSPAELRKRLQGSLLGHALLFVMSWGYGALVLLRQALYAMRLLPSYRLPTKTICIGNLTTGGTGKTSAVLLAAETLHKHQLKVAILSRGYKRPKDSRKVQVLLNTQNISWEQTGDEPWMMHEVLKGLEIPILVSPDRHRAGLEALYYYNSQVLLLDDGFQHFRLRRDLDILMVNASNPFGGGRLLPLGNLREPMRAVKRARMIVLTNTDRVPPEQVKEIRKIQRRFNPKFPILETVYSPVFLLDLKSEKKHRLSHLKGKQIAVLSAIGDPASFEDQLRGIGAETAQTWRYPDHHRYTPEELRSIESIRNGLPIVTTFKDVPRLPPDWQELLCGEVLALSVSLTFTAGKDIWEAELCKGLSPA